MNDKIGVIGLGRLGFCWALTLEKVGYNVIGCDIDGTKIDAIKSKTFKTREPYVEQGLLKSSNLSATTELHNVLAEADILFAVVRTDSKDDGKFDHSQLDALVANLISIGRQNRTKHFVICSNVMPGYSDTVYDRLKDLNYTVSYNPELVAQGRIMQDYESPDMVIIGEGNSDAGDILERIHNRICSKAIIHRMSRKSAEIFKVSLNCFLTTKITFANIVGDAALNAGAEPDKILAALGDDSRIGKKYFSHGFGYGGPCLPRDNDAFIQFAESAGINPMISKAVVESNKLHLDYQVEQFCKTHDIDTEVVMPYVTYKPGVTILTESQQLFFAVALAKRGYKIIIKDHPEVISQVSEKYGNLFYYGEIVAEHP